VEHYLNEPPGSSPRTIAAKLTAIIRFRRQIDRWAQAVKPDVVVAHDLHGYWGASKLLGRIPIVLHVHDMPNPDGGGPLGRLDRVVFRYAVRQVPRAAALVMPDASRLRIAQEWWRWSGPSFVAANCPILTEPGRTTILRDLIRERTGQTPEWVVVRAGGGGPVDETVRAFRFLPGGYHLCLLGRGDERDMSRLTQLARETGVQARVHQFPHLWYDDFRAYLRSADVGLAIYQSDGRDINKHFMGAASGKYMEYVAAGIPSVVTDQESFRKVADHTGAVVLRAETAEGIAECLLGLTRDPALYRRLCNLAQSAHRREYHYEHQYEAVCALIEGLPRRGVNAESVKAS
jgi:glycosyltransferase involved in cell wall biosynthesis